MPSKARKAFNANTKDIKRLLELHKKEGGIQKGRRYGLEVLNKSAIVLITAYWEAYCEDIAAEGLEHIIEHSKSAKALPKELKKEIAKVINSKKNELELWEIADDGWRTYLKDRLSELQARRNRRLNTPKSDNIDELFRSAVGISKISSEWRWNKKMTAQRAREKLDKYVTLRGAIAHRGQYSESVKKADVDDYFAFIKRLASKTGGAVNQHVKSNTGKPLWSTKRIRRRS
ncbi:MAG: hypothetical protein ISS63_13770 [Desulfobacteraceae bacterium]|nr:hypothetical protein [Desulfobacteraceae bacterium]